MNAVLIVAGVFLSLGSVEILAQATGVLLVLVGAVMMGVET